MTIFVIAQTAEKARAWMQVRGVQFATVVVEPSKLAGATKDDTVAYVGDFIDNPLIAAIHRAVPDNATILDIPEHERGDLNRGIGITSKGEAA